MPFTLAHPAAVIPLARPVIRRGGSVTALLVGSMAPDFPYYIFLSTGHTFAHSLLGALLVALPLGLAALWLYHVVLKLPVYYMLPVQLQVRLQAYLGPYSFFPPRRLAAIVLSLFIGIAAHLAWDTLTHPIGPLYEHLALLDWKVLEVGFYSLPLYKIFQHASTLGGIGLLVVWYYRWLKNGVDAGDHSIPTVNMRLGKKLLAGFGLASILPVLAFTGASLPSALSFISNFALDDLRALFVRLVLTLVLGLFLGLLCYSGYWHWTQRSRR